MTWAYRFLAIALLLSLTVPRMWQRGMFIVGIVYAVLSRNLAEGVGSLWVPTYSATAFSEFFEQPPLGFALESIPFRLFGDHFAIERIFSIVVMLATAMVIMAIWRRLFDAAYDWLPVILWLIPSVVTWAAINNMLENIQALTTTLAVYALLRASQEGRSSSVWGWSAFAGVSVVAATLIKGPVGFFPLAVPACLFLLAPKDRPRRLGALLGGLYGAVAVIATLLLSVAAPRRAVTEFARTHLLPVLHGTRGGGVTPFDIVRHMAAGIVGRLAVVVGILWLFRRRGTPATFSFVPATRFLLATGLLASVPILFSPKMAGHYFLPSIPFFALAAAGLALPAVRSFHRQPPGRWAARIPVAVGAALLLASTVVLASHGTLERRDRDMIDSLDAIRDVVPRATTIGTCGASREDWGLVAYMQRFYRVSLDAGETPVNGWYLIANNACAAPSGCSAVAQGSKLALHRCPAPAALKSP